MDATIIIILVAVLYVLFWIAVSAGIVYLFILIVKALKKYVNSKEVREEKKAVAKSLGEALKEIRICCQWIQAMLDVFIHCVILLCDRFTRIQSFRPITKAEGRNFFTEFLP